MCVRRHANCLYTTGCLESVGGCSVHGRDTNRPSHFALTNVNKHLKHHKLIKCAAAMVATKSWYQRCLTLVFCLFFWCP